MVPENYTKVGFSTVGGNNVDRTRYFENTDFSSDTNSRGRFPIISSIVSLSRSLMSLAPSLTTIRSVASEIYSQGKWVYDRAETCVIPKASWALTQATDYALGKLQEDDQIDKVTREKM